MITLHLTFNEREMMMTFVVMTYHDDASRERSKRIACAILDASFAFDNAHEQTHDVALRVDDVMHAYEMCDACDDDDVFDELTSRDACALRSLYAKLCEHCS